MQSFTGYEYIKIDLANAFGLDKELFETRIQWVDDHIDELESLANQADDLPLYLAGVMALRAAQQGIPTGHMVGLDACSSGIQIMGTLIGCPTTCESTGLVDPNNRADIYTDTTDVMNAKLAAQGLSVSVDRNKEMKPALMTHFYGSKAKPVEIFGEDTVELACFYETLEEVAPGAVTVMQMLLDSWQPFALTHEWRLPDGFYARCKNMEPVDLTFDIQDLGQAKITHRFYENVGTESGLSIAANIVHSIDGMLVREINRRCNYDKAKLSSYLTKLEEYLDDTNADAVTALDYSNFITLRLVDMINPEDFHVTDLSDLIRLRNLIQKTLQHKPFPIVCVHDEFKCHPNNMQRLRETYRDIFCELGDSNILSDILTQVRGQLTPVHKRHPNISSLIRQSNYALS